MRMTIPTHTAEKLADLQRMLPLTQKELVSLAVTQLHDHWMLARTRPMVPVRFRKDLRSRVIPILGERFAELGEEAKRALLADMEDGDPDRALRDFGFPTQVRDVVLSIVGEFQQGGPTDEA